MVRRRGVGVNSPLADPGGLLLGGGHLGDVRRLLPLGTIYNLELYLLALAEGAKARALNGGIMYEDIIAIGPLNESVPLRVVEPLHFPSQSHFPSSFLPRMPKYQEEHPGHDARTPPANPENGDGLK